MPEEYISREAALEDFEASNAHNPNWTPQRVKRSCFVSALPMLRRLCMAYGWRKTACKSAQIAVKNTNGMTTVHLTARTAEQK